MSAQSLGWEDPLEEETATHSSILERKILRCPWYHEDSDTTEYTHHFSKKKKKKKRVSFKSICL